MAKTVRNGIKTSPLEQMRRQLGAASAREHRYKQRIQDLERENAELTNVGAKYRTLYEEASSLCRDWCLLCVSVTEKVPGDTRDAVAEIYALTDRMEALGMLQTGGLRDARPAKEREL